MNILTNRILDKENNNGKVKTLMVFSIEVPSKNGRIVINDLWLKEINGKKIVSSTAKSYKNKNGETQWMNYVRFEGDVEQKVLELAINTYNNSKKKLQDIDSTDDNNKDVIEEFDI